MNLVRDTLRDMVKELNQETNNSPALSGDGDDDGLTHIWCCDPNTAHCGANIAQANELEPDEAIAGSPECVVCDDLEDGVCPRGCEWRQG